ncbi:HELB [Cervus elaphus hippelaphus]|uniref:HELB n=1 Tax=Cervus elaphus hippelaphus TaxID=46360 RepID=A0A212DER7_CEREH|nr:HELB [Cervus elaphus hippelaphus]
MASLSQPLLELQGPLLPPKDLVEDEDEYLREDAEGDEDTVFLDAEELCSGGVNAGSLPGRLRVSVFDENTQQKCDVFGRFPLTDAWWRVKVQVKPVASGSYQAQGFPSYFLQSDMSPPNQIHICSLFLKECNVSSEQRVKFFTWLNNKSRYKDLNFENLMENLRTCREEIEGNSKKQSTQKTQEPPPDHEMPLPLEFTFPFKTVMRALQFPKIMEFLPVLLPRHFKQLITSNSIEITYRELKLLRCEASWTSFRQCKSLFQLMTDLEKNALVIYSHLKQICREQGHTCVEEADLTFQLSDLMSFHDAWQSLKFLKDIGVVTYEKGCVFLSDLYQAERGIASSICDLMTRPPWQLQVDVKKVLASICTPRPENSGSGDTLNKSNPDETRSEDLVDTLDTQDSADHIWDEGENEVNAEMSEGQLDQDQVTALDMICSNAVTVISGKGGCGKTTIVSQLFKHIELLEEREVKKACEDFEQDWNVPQEWITFTEQSQQQLDKAMEVLLTAPTGKAAGLLRQKTGFNAYTLCQLLKTYCIYFFPFSGDVRQLPSIEPGNLLKDLFETLKSRNCAIELKTNHRAESELIVDNATRYIMTKILRFLSVVLKIKEKYKLLN